MFIKAKVHLEELLEKTICVYINIRRIDYIVHIGITTSPSYIFFKTFQSPD